MEANGRRFVTGRGFRTRPEAVHRRSGRDRDSSRACIFAVFAVAVMLSVAAMPAASEVSDAASKDWNGSWKCTVTVRGESIETKYSQNGGDLQGTTSVKGFDDGSYARTDGSWGFGDDGYGPFGSFYAAIDVSTGRIYKHLNPSDLSETMDGESIDAAAYNVMWVLPTVWMEVTDVVYEGAVATGSTLVMSSTKESEGMTAPAHTIDGETYKYLAIGVYEAYADGGKLYSRAGVLPSGGYYDDAAGMKRNGLKDFTDYAAATGADGGYSMLWNFYQYQLYRFCSLAVMQNFDSQEQIGMGNVRSNTSTIPQETGSTIREGPYFGTGTADPRGERLFIENAWGNLWEFIGDAYFYAENPEQEYWSDRTKLFAGKNSTQTVGTTDNLDQTTVTGGLMSYGTEPYSAELDSWGLPTATKSFDGIDSFWTRRYDAALLVGGDMVFGSEAGLTGWTHLSITDAAPDVGSRLAMVFNDDSMPMHSVIYDTDGGTPRIGPKSVQEDAEFAIDATVPRKEGYTFGGWSYGGEKYDPGDTLRMGGSNIVLKASWGHTVTFDLDGGEWDRGGTVIAEEGPYTVPDAVPTRDGYGFGGWRYGGGTVGPGGSIDLDSDITLKAVWNSSFVPLFPDDGDDPIEYVAEKDSESWMGKNGRTILLVAVIVAIIAELAVLTVSRNR